MDELPLITGFVLGARVRLWVVGKLKWMDSSSPNRYVVLLGYERLIPVYHFPDKAIRW